MFPLKAGPRSIVDNPLTELLREGARKLLAQAIGAELQLFLDQYRKQTDEDGRRRIVRNGYLPECDVQTGTGAVTVKVPCTRDRTGQGRERPAVQALDATRANAQTTTENWF